MADLQQHFRPVGPPTSAKELLVSWLQTAINQIAQGDVETGLDELEGVIASVIGNDWKIKTTYYMDHSPAPQLRMIQDFFTKQDKIRGAAVSEPKKKVPMTKEKAKRTAVDFVGACVGAAEADKFEEFEGEDWYDADVSVESQTDYMLTVRIGNKLVTLKPTSVSVLPD